MENGNYVNKLRWKKKGERQKSWNVRGKISGGIGCECLSTHCNTFVILKTN
jgi:hypothetical protein